APETLIVYHPHYNLICPSPLLQGGHLPGHSLAPGPAPAPRPTKAGFSPRSEDCGMTPRSRLFILLVPLLLFCLTVPEIRIPVRCRVKNRPPGRCGWCCLETLARYHKIRALYGLTERNACQACLEDLEDALEDAGVPYRIQFPGSHNTAILKSAIRRGRGA